MKNLILKYLISLGMIALLTQLAFAGSSVKVMVLDFPLNDLTDLPNPPEEIAHISKFNIAFKQKLIGDGAEIVPVNDQIKAIAAEQSTTYLFDHTDIVADLAKGSGADYIVIGLEMKPTYLFVYPRLLLVDVKKIVRHLPLTFRWRDLGLIITPQKVAQIDLLEKSVMSLRD